MSRIKKIKCPRGILDKQSGETTPIKVNKKGVITLSKENRIITKKSKY